MNPSQILLIHPPVVRPCEPPPGLARLAGALTHSGIPHDLIDLNLESLRWLSSLPPEASDTWTRRASGKSAQSLDRLTRPGTFNSPDRYRQAVSTLSRVLDMNGRARGIQVSLTDYQDKALSPNLSADLIRACTAPEENLFFPYFKKRLEEAFSRGIPKIAGVSLNFLSQALSAFAVIGQVRRLAPEITIVLGGGLVTSWMKRPGFQNPFGEIVDHLVMGPGEAPLLALLGKNIGNELALPDYDAVASLPYLSPGLVLPYSASTGCWWRRCAFCPEKAEKNPYFPTPASRAADHLNTLCRRYRPSLIHLTDNAVSPALLKALIKDPPGAPWYGFVRITKHLADPDFCLALRKSGCVMLQIGLESGSQTVLDAFGKGIDLATARQALAALAKAGIATYVYLLFGTPWEKEEDARLTLDFTVRHGEMISFLNLAVFNLPAHSLESEALETQPFYGGDLSLYRDFQHPDGWHRRHVRRFLDKEFTRHPAIAEILRKDPPIFTSSHAPFFSMAS